MWSRAGSTNSDGGDGDDFCFVGWGESQVKWTERRRGRERESIYACIDPPFGYLFGGGPM